MCAFMGEISGSGDVRKDLKVEWGGGEGMRWNGTHPHV